MNEDNLRDQMLKKARTESETKTKDHPVSGVNSYSASFKPFEFPSDQEYGVDRNEAVAYAELSKIRKMLGMPSTPETLVS